MKKIAWFFLLLSLAAGAIFIKSCGPGGGGVLARLSLDDGSDYLLTQEWGSWSEPYAIDFWYRPAAGEWGWCFIDCDDLKWADATLKHNPGQNSVQVSCKGELKAELFLGKETFALYGAAPRELNAPQEMRAPPLN